MFSRIAENLFTMLRARGYDIDSIDKPTEEDLELIVSDTVIFFCHTGVNTEMIGYIIKRAWDEKLRKIIIISFDKITPPAKAAINESSQKFDLVQVFTNKELMHDKQNHKYAYPHRLLEDEEVKDLVKKYKTPLVKFPHIFTSDPQIKYYGWKKGGLVEITRPTGIYYRYIIN